MKTAIFYQGYNRIENRNIIRIERSKLNRLLADESRLIETLTFAVKRRFSSTINYAPEVTSIWNKIQNHSLVQSIRRRINLLADAYPQFLSQIKQAGEQLKKRVIGILESESAAV